MKLLHVFEPCLKLTDLCSGAHALLFKHFPPPPQFPCLSGAIRSNVPIIPGGGSFSLLCVCLICTCGRSDLWLISTALLSLVHIACKQAMCGVVCSAWNTHIPQLCALHDYTLYGLPLTKFTYFFCFIVGCSKCYLHSQLVTQFFKITTWVCVFLYFILYISF